MIGFNPKMYKAGGLLKSPADTRDWEIKEILPLMAVEFPDNYQPDIPTFDQKDSNECAACAFAAIDYSLNKKLSDLSEPLSPSSMYANRFPNELFEGMYIRSVMKKAVSDGIVRWSDFPGFYTLKEAIRLFNQNRDQLLEKCKEFTIDSFYTCSTEYEIMSACYFGGGVEIGINVDQQYYHPDQNGSINTRYSGKSLGGHGNAIIGWRTRDSKQEYMIKNSWGEKYGENGNLFMTFDVLKSYLMDNMFVPVDNTSLSTIKDLIK